MKSIFDKLNLRPQERRLVVIVALVVFVLLNMWFVWPFFGDWGKVQNDLSKDGRTLERYNSEIAKRTSYERKQRELEQTGSEMLNNETDFANIISRQAAAAGVYVSDLRPGVGGSIGSKTNQFFQEQTISIQFNSGGKEIVDFLVGIASQNAMIRVRDMNIRPDASRTKLAGNIVFVGNYARPQPAAPSASSRALRSVTEASAPSATASKGSTNTAATNKASATQTPKKK